MLKIEKGQRKKGVKRFFDIFFSLIFLLLVSFFILILILLSAIDTSSIGLFKQKRIGLNGAIFTIYKIRTMVSVKNSLDDRNDSKITKFGSFLRKYKLDEFPQLINILFGEMSFVGPRPDVSGFADQLIGDDRIVLSVKPGLTGPASIVFRNEESLLAKQIDPERYNKEVIWPKKVKLNKEYVENYSFSGDIVYLLKTIFPFI